MDSLPVRPTGMNHSPVETPCRARYDSSMETPTASSPQLPSESSVESRAPGEEPTPARRFRLADLRRSDKILGGCACVLLASGLLLQGYGAIRGDASGDEGSRLVAENSSRTRGPGTLQPGATLVDDRGATREPAGSPPSSTQRSGESAAGDDLIEEWSPAMIRGGFGFFAGFAVGLVLRIFLRLSIIIVGLNLLLLLGLSYIGWLDVRWDTMEAQLSQWMVSLEEQFTQFKTFIAGSLPTVGLSGAGLFTGFRRR